VEPTRWHGADGLGNAGLRVAELHNLHPSSKVLCDEIRAASGEVTVVALGPLTNVAAALQRDPKLAEQIGRLIIMGGTHHGPGNVTPAADFNFYCDPAAARIVLRSPVTKTLIPLDVTAQLILSYDLLDRLHETSSKTGGFLRGMLTHALRAQRQRDGIEGLQLHDAVALAAASHAELFTTELAAADVETSGELTTGAVVYDRRRTRQWPNNVEVATEVDVAAVTDYILRGLAAAANC
jgi:inosine-uridine nucleoside N-ribohydrolase